MVQKKLFVLLDKLFLPLAKLFAPLDVALSETDELPISADRREMKLVGRLFEPDN
jgi:hypothetical protein